MAFDIIYDLVVRTEIPARNEEHALEKLKERLNQEWGNPHWGAEVIRDDNLFPGDKDDVSRHTNGFVILSSRQKHELLSEIQNALAEVKAGNFEAGERLMLHLYNRFDYLQHRSVPF